MRQNSMTAVVMAETDVLPTQPLPTRCLLGICLPFGLAVAGGPGSSIVARWCRTWSKEGNTKPERTSSAWFSPRPRDGLEQDMPDGRVSLGRCCAFHDLNFSALVWVHMSSYRSASMFILDLQWSSM